MRVSGKGCLAWRAFRPDLFMSIEANFVVAQMQNQMDWQSPVRSFDQTDFLLLVG